MTAKWQGFEIEYEDFVCEKFVGLTINGEPATFIGESCRKVYGTKDLVIKFEPHRRRYDDWADQQCRREYQRYKKLPENLKDVVAKVYERGVVDIKGRWYCYNIQKRVRGKTFNEVLSKASTRKEKRKIRDQLEQLRRDFRKYDVYDVENYNVMMLRNGKLMVFDLGV